MRILLLLLCLFLLIFASPAHAWWMVHGTFTSTGTNPTAVTTSLPGSPSVVMIKSIDDTTNGLMTIALSSFPATDSLLFYGNESFKTDCIISLDANGFTVGANLRCNTSGKHYVWQAWGTDAHDDFAVGTYTGDGQATHDVVISPAFQPVLCMTFKPSGFTKWMSTAMSGAGKSGFMTNSADSTTSISQFNSNGFRVLTSSDVNTNAIPYYYACWKANATGIYAGTQACSTPCVDNLQLTGFGHQPSFAWLKLDSAAYPAIRFGDNGSGNPATDDSFASPMNVASSANNIQQFLATGIEIGTGATVQVNAITGQYVEFGTPTYRRKIREIR